MTALRPSLRQIIQDSSRESDEFSVLGIHSGPGARDVEASKSRCNRVNPSSIADQASRSAEVTVNRCRWATHADVTKYITLQNGVVKQEDSATAIRVVRLNRTGSRLHRKLLGS